MKIAILSDIHANFQALDAVLADLDSMDVDEIVSLGDNIGYGPQPQEVIDALRRRGVISIMGNHELALAKPSYYARLHPDPRKSLDIQLRMMSREALEYCRGLPPLLIRHGIRFVHGCPPRSVTAYLEQPSMRRMERIFAGFPERVCFFGHLHTLERYVLRDGHCHHQEGRPGCWSCPLDSRCLLNPGSVGQPRDTIDRRAKYGLWDSDSSRFEIRAVSYESSLTKDLLRTFGFPVMNGARL